MEKAQLKTGSTKAAKQSAVEKLNQDHRNYLDAKRVFNTAFWLGFAVCLALAIYKSGFSLLTVIASLPRIADLFVKMAPTLSLENLWSGIASWYWGITHWLDALLTSLLMAFLATFLGTVFGGCLSFLASRNLNANYPVYFLTRRLLEILRTVPDIVWALLFIYPFGIGPLAGVLALTIHSMGAQGKLFAEVNENIDSGILDGVRAAGGNWLEELRFAVLPQVMPNFIAYIFWRLVLNVQAATVMGFVGAGGIGQELITALKLLYFEDAGAILLMIIATVFLIDMISERLRSHFLAGNTATGQARQISASEIEKHRSPVRSAYSMDLYQQAIRTGLWCGFGILVAYCLYRFGFFSEQFRGGFSRLGMMTSQMFPPSGWDKIPLYLEAITETLAIAFIGSVIGSLGAVPFAFLAARNMNPIRPIQFLTRRFADILRAPDYLVWGLVFVRAIGLGPTSGIMAVAIVNTGILITLYSEAIENIEEGQIDGVVASGGNHLQTLRFAVIPQVLPVMLSNAIYMFESNIRAASILGIVGAGGIGFFLSDALRAFEFSNASLIILMMIVVVYFIDLLSKMLREHFM